MSSWSSTRASRVLAALLRIGWQVKRQVASHTTLSRPGWPDFVWAFHEGVEIGPRMLARIDIPGLAKYLAIDPEGRRPRVQSRNQWESEGEA